MSMKMTMAEFVGLEPCPFCGGEADVIDYDDECWVAHQCANGTSVETNSYDTEAEAIAAWNSRAAMEFDNWFYLPKPKEPIVEVAETTHAWDGTKVKTDVFYQVQEQAVINWAKELDEHIIKRICEVWNSRAERTCKWELEHSGTLYDKWRCSKCGYLFVEPRCDQGYTDLEPNYCPNCGAKVTG